MFRKFQATHLFTGEEVLSSDQVLITTVDGTIVDIVPEKLAGEGIEFFEGLLTPGFVNVHCHLELSHLKGKIPPKTGLVDFVQNVMRLREQPGLSAEDQEFRQELKEEAMKNAANEMFETGIVAVGDICNTTDSISTKLNSKLEWKNFVEVSGFVGPSAATRLDSATKVLDGFNNQPSFSPALLTPHAPYSVSKQLFTMINQRTCGQLITIHNQESPAELDLYTTATGDFLRLYQALGIDISGFEPTGLSSFQSWISFFDCGQPIISVHNTFITEEDIQFAKEIITNDQRNISFCLCVNANMYIEDQFPPVDFLKNSAANITLGTDSYASNHQLSILDEIRTLQKLSGYRIALEEALRWGTLNGAKALRVEEALGSFKAGKKPGIVLIENLKNLQTADTTRARRIL